LHLCAENVRVQHPLCPVSGIMVGLLQAILYLYSRHAPGLLRNLRPIVGAWSDPVVPSAELVAFYGKRDEMDFSREILQKQPARLQVLMVPPCGWSDIGTPARLVTTLRTVPRQTADSASSSVRGLDLAAALASALALNPSIDAADTTPQKRWLGGRRTLPRTRSS